MGDLENRGLIYRKHGKGTFAHGRSTRLHRYLGILMKSPQAAEHRPIAELLRGLQTITTSLHSAILLITTPPDSWLPEKATSLGGVIVVPPNVVAGELEVLRNRNLPHLIFGDTNLPGPRVSLGEYEAARHMTGELLRLGHKRFALLSGYDTLLDATKRCGFQDALQDAGIEPTLVAEVSTNGEESGIPQAVRGVLELNPRPTAVVATDDSLALMLCHEARKNGIKVPQDLSIVSFHDWAYLNYIDVALTTVHFEFFAAGQKAAEALSNAALTGEPIRDITFQPTYRPGQTIGPPPQG